jgi:hypothetical protein
VPAGDALGRGWRLGATNGWVAITESVALMEEENHTNQDAEVVDGGCNRAQMLVALASASDKNCEKLRTQIYLFMCNFDK